MDMSAQVPSRHSAGWLPPLQSTAKLAEGRPEDDRVPVTLTARMNELGFTRLSLRQAKELVDHGVTADYIAACKKKFGKLFDLNDYIKLREADINPEQ